MASDADMMRSAAIAAEMQPGAGAAGTVPLTISTTGNETRTTEPAPGQLSQLKEAELQRAKAAEDTEELGRLEAAKLNTEASGLDDVALDNLMNLAETEDAIRRNKEQVQAAQAAAEQSHKEAEQAAKAIQNYDYWAHKSVGDRIIAKLAVGISGIGAAYLGQPNEILQSINRDIDRDFDMQKAYVTSKEHAAELRRKGVADIQAQLEKELAALKVKHAQSLEATAKKAEAMAKRAGATVEQAKQNIVATGLRAGSAEKSADALKDFEVHHSNQSSKSIAQHLVPGGGAPTESQAKTSLTAEQMADSLKIIEENPPLSQEAMGRVKENELAMQGADTQASKGFIPRKVVGAQRAVGLTPDSKYQGLSTSDQKVANAWDNVKELYVRQFTGAGMPETEALRAAEQYGPRPGDSPELVKQKFERQKRMVEQMRAVSGPGPAAIQKAQGSGPAPTVPRPGASDIEIAQVQRWIDTHKGDPRVPAAKAKLRRLTGAK